MSRMSVPAPLHRWPQCLPCHRLSGAGEGPLGPDLSQPMPAVSRNWYAILHSCAGGCSNRCRQLTPRPCSTQISLLPTSASCRWSPSGPWLGPVARG